MTRKSKPSRAKAKPGTLIALERAARRALELGQATGTPVYVQENGRIVDIAQRRRRK